VSESLRFFRTKPRYKLCVYISSPTRQWDSALTRLRKICDEQIPAAYEIEAIDLSKSPELTKDHNVVATSGVFPRLCDKLLVIYPRKI